MNRFLMQTASICVLAALISSAPSPGQQSSPAKKRILFIAGTPSHGFAQHEHNAGCMLLAKCLNESGLPVEAVVSKNGWPTDKSLFDGASAVVMYCDGGEGHVAMKHLDELESLAKKGIGIGCIHYGVEVPKGPAGDDFVKWIGGYFETDWSVNPEWKAEFKELPKHDVTRGVKPFTIFDEWYFHMRFPEGMKGVTPILSAVPPASTMSRKDGPHEGNATVREEVAKNLPQHMCWVAERPDGGRGFGLTGAHYHRNWGNDNFRKLTLNMICWIAKVDVPAAGVPSKTQTADDLLENLDTIRGKQVPANFDKAKLQQMVDEWNHAGE